MNNAIAERPTAPSWGGLFRRPESGAFIGLVAMFVFFCFQGGLSFLSVGAFASWLNIAAGLGIIAIPVGLLMIAGELDISVGSMVPAGSMTTAIIAGHFQQSIWLAVAAVLMLGVVIGLINGYLVVRTAVPSFIVTLGTLFVVAGTVLGMSVIITGTTSVAIKAPPSRKPSLVICILASSSKSSSRGGLPLW